MDMEAIRAPGERRCEGLSFFEGVVIIIFFFEGFGLRVLGVRVFFSGFGFLWAWGFWRFGGFGV